MASTVRDSNKGFCKYINSKRRSRDKIVPLVGENDHLRNIDMDKAEIFNVFFISVSNTDNISVFNTGTLRALSWRIVTAGRINSQPTLNLYGIWCSSWMHISLWGLSQDYIYPDILPSPPLSSLYTWMQHTCCILLHLRKLDDAVAGRMLESDYFITKKEKNNSLHLKERTIFFPMCSRGQAGSKAESQLPESF